MKTPKIALRSFVSVAAFCATALTVAALTLPNLFPFLDSSGFVSTFSSTGSFKENNAFFESLGTNGRTCASCHVVQNAMGLSAAHAEEVYKATKGRDPLLFSAVDGAVCPTPERGHKLDFSLLREKGLIRIGLTMPTNPQFTLRVVEDPYGCALTTDSQGVQTISVYRRPLPSTNLGFLSSVMWDGRETVQPLNSASTYADNLFTDLAHQGMDATLGHAQAATAPTTAQVNQIVNFEVGAGG